jgi:inosose dehydratase
VPVPRDTRPCSDARPSRDLRSTAPLLGSSARQNAAEIVAYPPHSIHPEVSSYVESPADVEAFLERIDPALLGLCFDAGHILVGGGDPVSLAHGWGERISHVHLKDVSGAVLKELRDGTVEVEVAWAHGLFCEFGEGEVDLAGVLAAPAIQGARWIVLEQDRIAVPRDDFDRVRAAEQRNLDFVRAAGLP